jgi:hypothetical protein
MLAMRASPAVRRAQGPFVLPARTLLLVSGLLAVALASVNLFHELHSTNVDIVYVAVAGLVALIWLTSLILAWRGSRLGVFLAGLIAFIEFGVIASGHFVTAPWDIHVYSVHEGLHAATVLMALMPACALTAMAAVVSWSHGTGHHPRRQTLPLLVVSVVGAILVILHATDNLGRVDFGIANAEDGTFAAVVSVIVWLVGAFWIARVRRTGALLVALGTFIVWYSFLTLHVVAGTSVSAIAAKSGPIWAVIALGMATLAAASFLAALAFLVEPVVRRRRSRPKATAATAMKAGG